MIVEKILKKELDIADESDLNSIMGTVESSNIEFKEIYHNRNTQDQIKENIIRSIVGFLNSSGGEGLLVLGIKTDNYEKASEITGVDKNALRQLKTEVTLESFIKGSIRSIPSFMNEYKIVTKIIRYVNKNVLFIEVKNKNRYSIYYSKITDYIYIRKGQETKKLNIEDTLNLISSRNYPQIYIYLERSGESKSSSKIYLNFKINYLNEGVKPSNGVRTFILIGSDSKLDITSRGYDFNIGNLNFDVLNLKEFNDECTHLKGFEFDYPHNSNIKIYPFKMVKRSYFSCLIEDIPKIKQIIALTFENEGITRQEFVVEESNDDYQLKEVFRDYRPYINL